MHSSNPGNCQHAAVPLPSCITPLLVLNACISQSQRTCMAQSAIQRWSQLACKPQRVRPLLHRSCDAADRTTPLHVCADQICWCFILHRSLSVQGRLYQQSLSTCLYWGVFPACRTFLAGLAAPMQAAMMLACGRLLLVLGVTPGCAACHRCLGAPALSACAGLLVPARSHVCALLLVV